MKMNARFVQIMSSRFGEELPINKKLVLSHVKRCSGTGL